MSASRARMCGPERAVIGSGEERVPTHSSIDEIMTRRFRAVNSAKLRSREGQSSRSSMSRDSRPAVRTFSPRTSTCWAAPQRPESRRRCWTRNETRRDEHVSEYKYYASDLPDPYLERRQEF